MAAAAASASSSAAQSDVDRINEILWGPPKKAPEEEKLEGELLEWVKNFIMTELRRPTVKETVAKAVELSKECNFRYSIPKAECPRCVLSAACTVRGRL